MGVLNLGLVPQAAAASAAPASAAATPAAAERPKSELWLNVGILLKGAGKDGEDVFLSLPGGGIAVDSLKAVDVRGNNVDWVHLQQAKNMLLEKVQAGMAGMTPGQRSIAPEFTVEAYRVGKPEQTADVTSNPLAAALSKVL